tara:strand:+ start:287 stop:421 length:135 start_codon:yes stop_codon:yes gene_type:complete
MKFTVTILQTMDVEAEDEDDACLIAAEMFDFGSAMFEVEVNEDE